MTVMDGGFIVVTLTLKASFSYPSIFWLVGRFPTGIVASHSFQCCITVSPCVTNLKVKAQHMYQNSYTLCSFFKFTSISQVQIWDAHWHQLPLSSNVQIQLHMQRPDPSVTGTSLCSVFIKLMYWYYITIVRTCNLTNYNVAFFSSWEGGPNALWIIN